MRSGPAALRVRWEPSIDATTDRSDLGIYGHGLSTFWLGPLIPAKPFEPEPGDTLFDCRRAVS